MDTATLTIDDLIQLNPAAIANPYPIYKQLRDYSPLFFAPEMGAWIASGHAEINTALRDSRFSSERNTSDEALDAWGMGDFKAIYHTIHNMMLFRDPPTHTRLRGLVSKAFTPRTVENLRQRIQLIVDEAIDKVEASGRMDVIADLALPLPISVIGDLLGVPRDHNPQLKRWSADFAILLGNFNPPPEEMARIQQSMQGFVTYFREITLRLRQQPEDNLLSALAQAEVAGEKLSEEELLANCILLLVAGHETTTNLIGNGTLALLRNPKQRAILLERPELIPNAVEELLRYDSPVQLISRLVNQPAELEGKHIEAGQFILMLLAAANHDPAQFPNPDRLDVTRENVKHLSFGGGGHYCLGAPLARLEGQIAFATMLRRLPNMELATAEPEWAANFGLRGLKALPVNTAKRRI